MHIVSPKNDLRLITNREKNFKTVAIKPQRDDNWRLENGH